MTNGTADLAAIRQTGDGRREAPLTPLQNRLRARCLAGQAGVSYNVCVGVRFRQPADVAALSRAWRLVTDRHEALRAVFPLRGNTPVQVILPEAAAADVIRLQSPGDDEITRTARRLWEAPIDLVSGPIARATLLTTPAGHAAALVLAVHHIVCDRWTLRLLTHDLMALYHGVLSGEPAELPPVPVSYANSCAWETELYATMREPNLAFWKSALAGAPALSTLPTASAPPSVALPHDGGRPRVGAIALQVDPGTAEKLRALARKFRVTPFMLIATIYGCVLGRFADQDDVVFGTQMSGRFRPESEQLAGFFINTLPLRLSAGHDAAFPEVVASVKAVVLAAVDHQVIPLEDIVAESGVSRVAGRHPIFQTVFQLLSTPAWGAPADGVDILSAPIEDPQFDLSLNCYLEPGGPLRGQLAHAAAIDATAAASFADCFVTACQQVAASGGHLRTGDIGAGPPESPRVTPLPVPPARRPAGELLTSGWKSWDHVAIEGAGDATYQELWAHTERGLALFDDLATAVRGAVVGIYGPVTPRLLGLVAATLLRGGEFVGLDPDWPPEWIQRVVDGARISFIAVDGTPLPPQVRDAVHQVADLGAPASAPRDTSAPSGSSPGGGHFPYVCFTSGTTGIPKGVLSTAAGLTQVLAEARAVPLSSAPRVLHGGLLTTEPRIRELLGALAVGGQVVFTSQECWQDPRQLCARLSAERITHLDAVTPSLLEALLRAHARSGEAIHLTEVHTFGEALGSAVAREAAGRWGCAVHAHYGVSEFAMSATDWRFDAAAPGGPPQLPLGDPRPGTRLYLVDSAGRQVPVGGRGEIAVGGASLAAGYAGMPAQTARRFVPDPWGPPGSRMFLTGDLAVRCADGWAQFLGRKDRQVNVRGFRVEPEGIEASLRASPGVRDAAVAVARLPSGNKLVAAVVTDGNGMAESRARAYLAQALPRYLGEVTLAFVPEIPYAATGKIDLERVLRLADRPDSGPSSDGPGAQLQPQVTLIWEAVLQRRGIGPRESFYDLGGHSLNAFEVVAAIEERLGLECSVQLVMNNPTIEVLSAALAEMSPADNNAGKAAGNEERGS